ncbi:MAG: NAD(P)H-hydrate dehydratase [Lewinellaceae bacterium]|nr:NAD(P)H-hydrate dehydratase [Lewinella sp.]MCB9281108.1 NAD(P)H-hydrate dehydratase [Lewinellaceae bacterium]
MKLFNAAQIRQWDAYTIQHEPIDSIDLMERASRVFAAWIEKQAPDRKQVAAFCGPGNNGGDGLAASRMLAERGYQVRVYCCQENQDRSEDNQINLDRLRLIPGAGVHFIYPGDPLPEIHPDWLVLDGLFGSGLNRPLKGFWAGVIEHLNRAGATIAAIDIPSGLFADQPSEGPHIQAEWTLSFEIPKTAFLMAENQDAVGLWSFRSIGLAAGFAAETPSNNYFNLRREIAALRKKRRKHDHKGTFGHALIIAGSYGKMGAAVLSAKGALKAGAGLVTARIPECGYAAMQTALPEVMADAERSADILKGPFPDAGYQAAAIGPGLGTAEETGNAVRRLIQEAEFPMVLDADALNLLARNPGWLEGLPANTILTPHPKEFERLFGPTPNSFERLDLLRNKARHLGIYIVLKGAFTCIATPEGNCYFNSTGNPGMGTGGSGDVLTGILAGLLAQGYTAGEACLLGVYLHGLAGDLAAAELSQEALTAGDICNYLGKAYQLLDQ